MSEPHLRGEVKILPLSRVKPNGWNPNVMTPEMKASLKHGLVEDGWLVSQALLIWGSDEKGEAKNLIIDGEHRYEAATELGMKKGPMVVLDGLTETEAKALTVKMNQKRGDWNTDSLAKLLGEIASGSRDGLSGVSLGFNDEELMKLLATSEEVAMPPDVPRDANTDVGPAETQSGEPPKQPDVSSVRMVQLFLDDKTQPAFLAQCQQLAEKWGTKNVTDTVLRAVELAAEADGQREADNDQD